MTYFLHKVSANLTKNGIEHRFDGTKIIISADTDLTSWAKQFLPKGWQPSRFGGSETLLYRFDAEGHLADQNMCQEVRVNYEKQHIGVSFSAKPPARRSTTFTQIPAENLDHASAQKVTSYLRDLSSKYGLNFWNQT